MRHLSYRELSEQLRSGPSLALLPVGCFEQHGPELPLDTDNLIATEAARRVLEHAFDAGLERVLAVTHPDNAASQAVARRIGMRDEGLTDAYYDTTCRLFRVDWSDRRRVALIGR